MQIGRAEPTDESQERQQEGSVIMNSAAAEDWPHNQAAVEPANASAEHADGPVRVPIGSDGPTPHEFVKMAASLPGVKADHLHNHISAVPPRCAATISNKLLPGI